MHDERSRKPRAGLFTGSFRGDVVSWLLPTAVIYGAATTALSDDGFNVAAVALRAILFFVVGLLVLGAVFLWRRRAIRRGQL